MFDSRMRHYHFLCLSQIDVHVYFKKNTFILFTVSRTYILVNVTSSMIRLECSNKTTTLSLLVHSCTLILSIPVEFGSYMDGFIISMTASVPCEIGNVIYNERFRKSIPIYIFHCIYYVCYFYLNQNIWV